MISRSSLVGALAALLLPLWANAQSPPAETFVTGVVFDAQGHPVAGAKVGTAFRLASSYADTRVIIGYDQPPGGGSREAPGTRIARRILRDRRRCLSVHFASIFAASKSEHA
jgi:hypothetical protein